MRRWASALVLILLWATVVAGQAAPSVYWHHDGLNVTRFLIVIDKGTPTEASTDVGMATLTSGQCHAPVPTLTRARTLTLRACNHAVILLDEVCTDSHTLVVVKL